jgi:4-hydroxybenzoate polyprenyltransferase
MTPAATEQPAVPSVAIPLCVDLDGTLLRTDLLLEGMLRLLRRNPGYVFLMVIWLLRGRNVLKAEVAKRVDLAIESLPANEALLEWLRSEKATGRSLVLCTSAWHTIAAAVAGRFAIFDEVLATDETVNLLGGTKARRLVETFGHRGFDYVGNALSDLSVWRRARAAIVVEPTLALAATLHRVANLEKVFAQTKRRWASWLRACRIHQWSKNLLVLVPALAAQRILEAAVLGDAMVALASFSLAASGNYLLNDLFDLDADRAHPTKRRRPFASGELQIPEGLLAAVLLIASGLAVGGFVLGRLFFGVLLAYLLVSWWYSLALKRHAMVDIMCLAALYTLRVIAGSVATGIESSFWLLAFSMFLFLSLAAAKRVSELGTLRSQGATASAGRGYDVQDLPLLLSFGVASGYLSVLVMALYVESGAETLYAEPRLLWLICPVLLYWISRIWLKAHRLQLHEDPVVFALNDRPSQLAGILCVLLVVLAA